MKRCAKYVKKEREDLKLPISIWRTCIKKNLDRCGNHFRVPVPQMKEGKEGKDVSFGNNDEEKLRRKRK